MKAISFDPTTRKGKIPGSGATAAFQRCHYVKSRVLRCGR